MKQNKIMHGESKTRLYNIWINMKNRCYGEAKRKERDSYNDLEVSSLWVYDFLAFKEWALSNGYQDDLSIDRIDNKKGYYPDNCRWTTVEIQNQNQRRIKSNNTSGFRGVYFYPERNKQWWAYINIEGKRTSLGYFYSPYQAAFAYNNAVVKFGGEQPLNIIEAEGFYHLVSCLGKIADLILKKRNAEGEFIKYIAHLDGISKMNNTNLTNCWNKAYEDIKDRKGYLNKNGTFIKEGDIENKKEIK